MITADAMANYRHNYHWGQRIARDDAETGHDTSVFFAEFGGLGLSRGYFSEKVKIRAEKDEAERRARHRAVLRRLSGSRGPTRH